MYSEHQTVSKASNMISIVIPCYNEEGNIQVLYERLVSVLVGDYEILFVDDGSTDGTLDAIRKLNEENQDVKYISFSRNFGHQNALKAGYDHAKGDCVISMDGDLQHPPELIPDLIKKWKEGYDIVNTIRSKDKSLPIFKKWTAGGFYKLINYLGDIDIPYGAADFRLLDKKVVVKLKEDFNEYYIFYRGVIPWMGFNQGSIEYQPEKRHSGVTKYSFLKMFNFAVDGITSFSIKPLRLAIITGVLISLLAFVYAVIAVGYAVFTDVTQPGWASVIISILFIGGIQLIFLGILGEYLGKMFMETKHRPHYIIKELHVRTSKEAI